MECYNDIRKIAYELYKIHWMNEHRITRELEMVTLRDYFKECQLSDAYETYEDYLNEFGFDGELYVCFDEFCNNEFLDKELMEQLLKQNFLCGVYESYMDNKDKEDGAGQDAFHDVPDFTVRVTETQHYDIDVFRAPTELDAIIIASDSYAQMHRDNGAKLDNVSFHILEDEEGEDAQ